VARAIEDYSSYLDRAPGWDGGNWQQLVRGVRAFDDQRRQVALQRLADIHVAACTRVGNEQFHGETLDPELEWTCWRSSYIAWMSAPKRSSASSSGDTIDNGSRHRRYGQGP
jgi:hypothetical protein